MLDLQCFSSRNYERRNGEEYNSVSRMLNSAGYSKIKETIYMVPIPEVAYYLPGEMKNVSCLCSKAMGVYRTIYSSLIRDQLRQAAIHWAKEPALPSLDRSPSWRRLLLQLVAEIPNTGCLGMQNLIVVRLYLFVVRNWLSTVTLGILGIKLFPGPQVTNSGIIAGYQYLLLEMLWRISIAPDKLFREDICLLICLLFMKLWERVLLFSTGVRFYEQKLLSVTA